MKKLRSLFALFLAGLLISLLLVNSVLALNSIMLNFGDRRLLTNTENQIITFGRSSTRRRYLQQLEEADRFYQQGAITTALKIQKQVKESFSDTGSGRRKPIDDPEQLSGGAANYYRKGKAFLEKNLPTKALIPLQRLSEDYPEFILGHLMLAEAVRQVSDEDAKIVLKKSKLDVELEALERGSSIFPEQKDLLDARIKAFASYDKFIEASVTARQFWVLFPKDPDSGSYLTIAEEYLQKHRRDIQEKVLALANFGSTLGGSKIAAQIAIVLSQSESEFGSNAVEQYKQKYEIVNDLEVVSYVNRIGQKVAKTLGRNEFKYEFYIYKDDNDVNAFALPGGKVFVSSGILQLVGTEAELAGLLGHEVGHAVLSHSYIKYIEQIASEALGNFFDINSLLDIQLAENSRSMEKQADILGTRSLVAGGYAADGLWNVMRVLKSIRGYKYEQANYLASHPSPSDRVSYLEEFIERNSFNRFAYEGVSDFKKMQKRLRGEDSGNNNNDKPASTPETLNTRAESIQSSVCKAGKVSISTKIEKQKVAVIIDGGYVANNCTSFTVRLRIKNDSDRSFTFAPGFVQVFDSNDKALKSRIIFKDGQTSTVEPNQEIEPRLQVFGHRWRNDGKQNLTIELKEALKESSSLARVFRVAF